MRRREDTQAAKKVNPTTIFVNKFIIIILNSRQSIFVKTSNKTLVWINQI